MTKKSPSHPLSGRVVCLSQARVPYQRPGSLKVLHGILAVPNIALFWTETSDVLPGICWSHSSSLLVTAPSAPIITGTSVAFTPHIFFSSSFSPWYFFKLLLLMLLSLGIATFIATAFLYCLLINMMSHWLAITSLSMWILFHMISAR